jgi:hypothetical protein
MGMTLLQVGMAVGLAVAWLPAARLGPLQWAFDLGTLLFRWGGATSSAACWLSDLAVSQTCRTAAAVCGLLQRALRCSAVGCCSESCRAPASPMQE